MFNYTIWRDLFTGVGVMFTLLLSILITNVHTVPLSSLTAKEFNYDSKVDRRNYTLALNQNLVKIHNSDHVLLRLVIVFVGIVLVFAMLICLCAMYWCVCWAVQWTRMLPTSTQMTTSSWNNLVARSRTRATRKHGSKEGSSDLPPPYEVILAHQVDEAATRMTARSTETDEEEEEEPPSYIEVLNKNHGVT